jgi:hypothetical protein
MEGNGQASATLLRVSSAEKEGIDIWRFREVRPERLSIFAVGIEDGDGTHFEALGRQAEESVSR